MYLDRSAHVFYSLYLPQLATGFANCRCSINIWYVKTKWTVLREVNRRQGPGALFPKFWITTSLEPAWNQGSPASQCKLPRGWSMPACPMWLPIASGTILHQEWNLIYICLLINGTEGFSGAPVRSHGNVKSQQLSKAGGIHGLLLVGDMPVSGFLFPCHLV